MPDLIIYAIIIKLNMRKLSKLIFSGFTLIELLVVISIIAILIGLSAFGLQGARESARDSRRMADLETIRSALELFKADCGKYPASITYGSALPGDNSTSSCPSTNVYLQRVPQDPVGGTRTYVYAPAAAPARTYSLCAALEENTTAVSGCGSGCGVTCSYRVTNP